MASPETDAVLMRHVRAPSQWSQKCNATRCCRPAIPDVAAYRIVRPSRAAAVNEGPLWLRLLLNSAF